MHLLTEFTHWSLHIIDLQVMRQTSDETTLVNAINELSTGTTSACTKQFLNSLCEVPKLQCPQSQLTHLCALNDQVFIYNHVMLETLKGKLHTYESVDTGDRSSLLKMNVEKVSTVPNRPVPISMIWDVTEPTKPAILILQ